ncbi:hypothetical protein [Enterovirga rhinocerotis]|uniref:Uncharacterized protein n=1 Tax=Enterovirga rhinocerotis TaxID=1339210 RepID=A0A4R7BVS5_9HYPH|nr:hypothetical protein [Enterovirga rhinocerotis]TDR89543.1 hypothetical protein EV668_2373 [Enterovirga rhinocerotis]
MPRHLALRSFIDTVRAERVAKPALVSGGRFNRSAIMREAVAMARSINRSFGSWQVRMRIALRTVWARAKAAMVETCAAEPFAIREPVMIRPRPVVSPYRGRVFHSGSRAAVHGW